MVDEVEKISPVPTDSQTRRHVFQLFFVATFDWPILEDTLNFRDGCVI